MYASTGKARQAQSMIKFDGRGNAHPSAQMSSVDSTTATQSSATDAENFEIVAQKRADGLIPNSAATAKAVTRTRDYSHPSETGQPQRIENSIRPDRAFTTGVCQ